MGPRWRSTASRAGALASRCSGRWPPPAGRNNMPSNARILVVDDHVEMGEMLKEPLTDAGYLVDVASSGAEAIAQLRARLYDIVLCDLRMKEVDGLDVLAAALKMDPGLPVL